MVAVTATVVSLAGFGQGESVSANTSFSDVNGHWAQSGIIRATQDGLVKGYPDGTFRPNDSVTTAEFATMLIRAYGEGERTEPFPFGTEAFMREMNYPYSSDRHKKILRSQVAELVTATKGYNLSGDVAIKYLLGYGLANGKVPGEKSVASFKGGDVLTRAEAVVFIDNVRVQGLDKIQPRPNQREGADFIREIEERYNQEKTEKPVALETDIWKIYPQVKDQLFALGFTTEQNSGSAIRLEDRNGVGAAFYRASGRFTILIDGRSERDFKAAELVATAAGLNVDREFRTQLEKAKTGSFNEPILNNGIEVRFSSGHSGELTRITVDLN